MGGLDLTKVVTCDKAYEAPAPEGAPAADLHVVAYDYGIKRSMLGYLAGCGFRVTVVPAQTSANEVLKLAPDGVFLSNGPGDPAAVTYAVKTIERLLGKVPVFGICLGHQLLAQALGLSTFKLKFGHRGANHPVKDLRTGVIEITTQNHGFAVKDEQRRRRRDHATSTSTTAPWRASRPRSASPSPCSTTRSRRPVRTTRCISSRGSATRSTGSSGEGRPDAAPRRPPQDPHHRLGPHRHRAGLRVRLLRHAGLQGAARRGLRGRARQQQPRDDHDRPRVRHAHLHRAARPHDTHAHHRGRAPGRPAAHARRADGAQPGHGAQGRRCARPLGGRDDRRRREGHPPRRGPPRVPQRHGRDRPAHAAQHAGRDHGRGRGRLRGARPSARRPPGVHAGRHRRRHRLRPRQLRAHLRAGTRAQPDLAGPPRGVRGRLARVRARGDARPRRQRRDHLLHREHRPDGRAHRRQRHRRAGAHAHRRPVPGAPRRFQGHHPQDRRRHRRQQRPVRGRTPRPARWSSSR